MESCCSSCSPPSLSQVTRTQLLTTFCSTRREVGEQKKSEDDKNDRRNDPRPKAQDTPAPGWLSAISYTEWHRLLSNIINRINIKGYLLGTEGTSNRSTHRRRRGRWKGLRSSETFSHRIFNHIPIILIPQRMTRTRFTGNANTKAPVAVYIPPPLWYLN